jgi:hypothetical protein
LCRKGLATLFKTFSKAKPPGLSADKKDLLRDDEEGVVVASLQDTRLGVVADESSWDWSVFVGVAKAFVRCMTAPKRVLLLASSADVKSLLE